MHCFERTFARRYRAARCPRRPQHNGCPPRYVWNYWYSLSSALSGHLPAATEQRGVRAVPNTTAVLPADICPPLQSSAVSAPSPTQRLSSPCFERTFARRYRAAQYPRQAFQRPSTVFIMGYCCRNQYSIVMSEVSRINGFRHTSVAESSVCRSRTPCQSNNIQNRHSSKVTRLKFLKGGLFGTDEEDIKQKGGHQLGPWPLTKKNTDSPTRQPAPPAPGTVAIEGYLPHITSRRPPASSPAGYLLLHTRPSGCGISHTPRYAAAP
ncbi:hypothetical protein J6590_052871 [Homalodisca vitripennis]|nr:hypothetical protein J6590_052871 [Homalodisca vitripennis]